MSATFEEDEDQDELNDHFVPLNLDKIQSKDPNRITYSRVKHVVVSKLFSNMKNEITPPTNKENESEIF